MAPSPLQNSNCGHTDDPSEVFDEAKILTIPVNPARLAWGQYDHGRNRRIGEGDIHASYSADVIAMEGRIRKTFGWQANLMVTVSISGVGGVEEVEAYRLVPLNTFIGTPQTYREKTDTAENAEAARRDPNGFYHGMTVKQGREIFVLAGPPVIFVGETSPDRPDGVPVVEAEQLSLF